VPPKISELQNVFANLLKNGIYLAGVATLLMLVYGGFSFLVAGSDKEGTAKAQKTITYGVGGLILVICSWLILNLLGSFLGINLNNFNICLPGSTC
jgi:hypothetical protein